MVLRLSLNVAAHLAAGVAFGALAAAAYSMRTREDNSVASAQTSTTGTAQNSDNDR